MVPPLKVLKIKDQKGKVYVPNLGIEITVINTDPKGLYIVGKNNQGETVCVDSKDCELIKEYNIDNTDDKNINVVNETNDINKIDNSNAINKSNTIKEEKNKVKTKLFSSKFRKK